MSRESAVTAATTPSIRRVPCATPPGFTGLMFPAGSVATSQFATHHLMTGFPSWRIRRDRTSASKSFDGPESDA
jgi:hypothetical protein